MLRARVIPCLLLERQSLVKTVRFKNPKYVGDPANTCRIFNELEVDELAFLDIAASKKNLEPNYKILAEIADQCFMPVSYGGGVSNVAIAEKILKLGFEKIVLNTHAINNPNLICDIARLFGSQCVIVAIDVKRSFFGKEFCRGLSGTFNTKKSPVEWAKEVQDLGAGEILLTDIDREGTWSGFNIELIEKVASEVSIPVIAHGGAASVEDISAAINKAKASAVALGSMVVYQKKDMGVLINFPDSSELSKVIN